MSDGSVVLVARPLVAIYVTVHVGRLLGNVALSQAMMIFLVTSASPEIVPPQASPSYCEFIRG
jgi:hypothetical protein